MAGTDFPRGSTSSMSDAASDSLPRAPSLFAVVTYLQEKAEAEKAELTRELHDNLGGLMVAAMMDAAWAQSHLGDSTSVALKLDRLRKSLMAAIDLKRRLIEAVRPTLLDNFGLFAALRWLFKHRCEAASFRSVERLPTEEIALPTAIAIGVFRIVEEALLLLTERNGPVDLAAPTKRTGCPSLALTAEAGGAGIAICLWQNEGSLEEARLLEKPVFASMAHRIELLGGTHAITFPTMGGSALIVRIPLNY